MNFWYQLGCFICFYGKQYWGIRRKRKIELVKELRLIISKGLVYDDDLCIDVVVDGWG